jgi:ADP-ribosyl-[dinitrogen reductase] hydrolase
MGETGLRTATDPSKLAPPRGGPVDWDRVAGMLVGLAVGDSLGNTSESMVPSRRRAIHGEIRNYLPNLHAGGQCVGLPSDDTQLAFRTLEQLLEDGTLVPQRLAERFSSTRIFGMGSTVRAFLRKFEETGDWRASRQESAGNGALMRIAPVLIPHLGRPSSALWQDALVAGAITHDDYASNASCVAFTALLWDALHAAPRVPPGFWLDRFVTIARAIEGPEPRYEPRAPHRAGRRTTLADFVATEVPGALREERSIVDACEDWYSGAFLLETVPSVLFILERCSGDPEEAIVRAVNDTRDNDTAAAIVGAAVGALHSLEALPERWRKGLSGRLGSGDDGRIFELLKVAERKWSPRLDGR